MNQPGHKPAESEFDDLLGQLVDELAMTPASESAVQLIPEPPLSAVEPAAQPDLDAEGATVAATGSATGGSGNLVKIVGIITGSLTVVAIAAIAVFSSGEAKVADADAIAAAPVLDQDRVDEIAQTEQAAVARAQAERMARERAELTARAVRIEAGLLSDELAAQKAAEEAERKRKSKRKRRSSSKRKPSPKPKDAFEDL